MNKTKIYHLLLGIGLGIIITSSLNIVFNKTEKIEYTDEEIREKAKNLGMISIKENIENNDKEKKEQKEQDQKKNQQQEPAKDVAKVEEPDVEVIQPTEQVDPQTKEGYKMIAINMEDTASSIIHKLKINGVIENEKELKQLVVKHNLQTKFRTGTYEIKESSTYEEVLKQLIKENDLKKAGFL